MIKLDHLPFSSFYFRSIFMSCIRVLSLGHTISNVEVYVLTSLSVPESFSALLRYPFIFIADTDNDPLMVTWIWIASRYSTIARVHTITSGASRMMLASGRLETFLRHVVISVNISTTSLVMAIGSPLLNTRVLIVSTCPISFLLTIDSLYNLLYLPPSKSSVKSLSISGLIGFVLSS